MTIDDLTRRASRALTEASRDMPIVPMEVVRVRRRRRSLAAAAVAVAAVIVVGVGVLAPGRRPPAVPATTPDSVSPSTPVTTGVPGSGPFDTVILPMEGFSGSVVVYSNAGLESGGRVVSLHDGLDPARGRSLANDGQGGYLLLTADNVLVWAPSRQQSRPVERFDELGSDLELLGVVQRDDLTWAMLSAPESEHPIELVLLDDVGNDRLPAWPQEDEWSWVLDPGLETLVARAQGRRALISGDRLIIEDEEAGVVLYSEDVEPGSVLHDFDGRRALYASFDEATRIRFTVVDPECPVACRHFVVTGAPAGAVLIGVVPVDEPVTRTAGEADCRVVQDDLQFVEQDLPERVGVARRELFTLAGQCDLDGLHALTGPDFLPVVGHQFITPGWKGALAVYPTLMVDVREALSYPPFELRDGSWRWPGWFDVAWSDLTEEMKDAVTRYYVEHDAATIEAEWEDLAQLGVRLYVEIEADGTIRFVGVPLS